MTRRKLHSVPVPSCISLSMTGKKQLQTIDVCITHRFVLNARLGMVLTKSQE